MSTACGDHVNIDNLVGRHSAGIARSFLNEPIDASSKLLGNSPKGTAEKFTELPLKHHRMGSGAILQVLNKVCPSGCLLMA